MSVLYVQKQGAKLVKSGGRVNIVYDKQTITSVPAMKIRGVVLFGNIKITTPLIRWFLYGNIPVAFMNTDGNFCGKLTGKTNPDYLLRLKQTQLFQNKEKTLYLAKELVKAKLLNTIDLLLSFNRRRNSQEITDVINNLKEAIRKIEIVENQDSLRGIEGFAARKYFSVFKLLINPEELEFKGRERRGSNNPVNSMLNYIYGVIRYFTYYFVELAGLDPFAGFYHSTRYNRPSLTLDLMENFRSIGDRIILKLINKKMVDFDNFDFDNKDYVLISEKTRNLIISEFEKNLGLSSCFIENNPVMSQTRSLENFIKGKTSEFNPYLIKTV
ncbi:MAG: CRISPR-associated endonuclease Cas1 [Candidatus Muirbacterium halophilum]|nr:CRISPR-associated endonuclease Cas1 [Candidatus Muirbacterium halophilum]